MEFIQFDDFLFDLENNNGALIVGADQSTDEDTPISFDVSAYDFDGGDATLTSVAFSGMGTLSTMVADPDLVQNMGVGETISVSFDPGSDYDYLAVGDMVTETVTLSFEDGQGAVTSRSFDITITGVNDDPTASDSTGSVTEDATLVATGNVGAADVDQGTTLSYAVVGGGAGTYGALTVDGDGNWTYTLDNDAANVQALDTGDVEVDSFMIEVSDGDGGSTTVSVDIDVNGADDISLVPGTVGYYSMSSGMGRSAQVNEITQAGYAAQNITDLSASELAELPVLYVWNENNNGYGSEYLSNLANIEQAVAEGMTLIIHDRHVENAESILPGGAGFNIVRDFSDPADIDLLPGATGTIQSGPRRHSDGQHSRRWQLLDAWLCGRGIAAGGCRPAAQPQRR